MTQDEIIRMAREAGFAPNSSYTVLPMQDYANNGVSYELERFASLVAAHEREACAEICDWYSNWNKDYCEMRGFNDRLSDCAATIRARNTP